MSDIPATRYAKTSDGVHIAYQTLGEAPRDLILIEGFISHVEIAWEEPGIARFRKDLASFSRLIMFDKRGVGVSDRVATAPTLEQRMDDVLAVMDAVGSERAVLMGISEGAPVSALFAARDGGASSPAHRAPPARSSSPGRNPRPSAARAPRGGSCRRSCAGRGRGRSGRIRSRGRSRGRASTTLSGRVLTRTAAPATSG